MMKYGYLLLVLLITAGCAAVGGNAEANELPSQRTDTPITAPVVLKATASPATANLERSQPSSLLDLGEAPEFKNTVWLNSNPLRLADLRGKVVLVDMWTFG